MRFLPGRNRSSLSALVISGLFGGYVAVGMLYSGFAFLCGAADSLLTLLMTVGFGALFALSYRVFVPRFGLAPGAKE